MMQSNAVRLLAWFSAAATLNSLWIFTTASVVWMYRTRSGPIAGEIWLLPGFFWVCTGPFVLLSCLYSSYLERKYPGYPDAKPFAFFSLAIFLCGPMFALIYFGIL